MTRVEFIDHIKYNTDDYSIDDCISYYKYFHDAERHKRLRALGGQVLERMGEAYTKYWNNAINQYDRGKMMVQLPNGYHLGLVRRDNTTS